MGERTGIAWTDATWNPVTGCSKVSPGCAHCYAERLAERFRGVAGHPYEQGFDVRLWPTRLIQPSQWISPRRIFVCSMADLFQDAVPEAFLDQVFAIMALAPWHTFQLLTKRPERMASYLMGQDEGQKVTERVTELVLQMDPEALHHLGHTAFEIDRDEDGKIDGVTLNWPLSHIWLGVSVENQTWADRRIPWLLQIPATVRFVSVEPLLEGISLRRWFQRGDRCRECGSAALGFPEICPTLPPVCMECGGLTVSPLHWVIVGGESGPGARLMETSWVRTIRDQCVEAQVSFFFKQWGGKTPKAGGNLLDGRAWEEFPQC